MSPLIWQQGMSQTHLDSRTELEVGLSALERSATYSRVFLYKKSEADTYNAIQLNEFIAWVEMGSLTVTVD